MKEIAFIKKNLKYWEEFEKLINQGSTNADHLSNLYINLTDDLAYAQTYFPGGETSRYLNSLAIKAHQQIYKNKKIKRNRIFQYWLGSFPLLIYSARKEIFYSASIFIISAIIGAISAKHDDTFVRLILGDNYVNMTLENIQKGDPMAVYKKMNRVDMFLGISINNIYVSFLAFIMGTIFTLGTGYILLRNGIMLGAFQYFFYQHGLFTESVATIWIHGTLEIFCIIVAGGAGIMLGKSFIFPQTHSRLQSFRQGAIKGIKIMLGLIPFFMIAAFFEGFITRHTSLPYSVRFVIIFISVAFICYYFFIFPYYLNQKNLKNDGKRIH